MRTLNEQIQRLRDALVTCYNAIKSKGGTIPEAGKRTLLNMPAAVISIPQTQGVLTELNVTQNGEYLPSDYDADGFSKVTVEFDTSSLPKVKVTNFTVNNDCINEDGVWYGELMDIGLVTSLATKFAECSKLKKIYVSNWNVSNVTNFAGMFRNCSGLETIDFSNWDISNVTNIGQMFTYCSNLQYLDVSNWDTSSITLMNSAFAYCSKLQYLDVKKWDVSKVTNMGGMFHSIKCQQLDLTNWDVSNVTNVTEMFMYANLLQSLIGGRGIDDVISNNISCLKGLKISNPYMFYNTILDRASLRALINGLADLTGQTAQTLNLGATLMAKLTEEDIAIAVNKNWTIA